MFAGEPPSTDDHTGELVLLGIVAWLAYSMGKSHGAKARGTAPSVHQMFGSYLGLQAMNALFGGLRR